MASKFALAGIGPTKPSNEPLRIEEEAAPHVARVTQVPHLYRASIQQLPDLITIIRGEKGRSLWD